MLGKTQNDTEKWQLLVARGGWIVRRRSACFLNTRNARMQATTSQLTVSFATLTAVESCE